VLSHHQSVRTFLVPKESLDDKSIVRESCFEVGLVSDALDYLFGLRVRDFVFIDTKLFTRYPIG
jgi:hypothetical protein